MRNVKRCMQPSCIMLAKNRIGIELLGMPALQRAKGQMPKTSVVAQVNIDIQG